MNPGARERASNSLFLLTKYKWLGVDLRFAQQVTLQTKAVVDQV